MPITSRVFVQSSIALLLVGFLALTGIVAMTYWLGERAQLYFNEVIEVRDARSAAVELRNALQTAESSQRGFLFSGNEIYLAPYDTAKALALRQLGNITRTTASNTKTSAMVRRLSTLIAARFADLDEAIALKRARRDAEAMTLFRTNRGKALMDEANVFFSGIINASDEQLTTGQGEQRANATLLRWFSSIGGLIIILVTAAAVIAVVQYTRELRTARNELDRANADLEERVRRRTRDLVRANEDIQRFVHIVTHDLRAPLVSIVGFTGEFEAGLKSVQALVQRNASENDAVAQEADRAAMSDLPDAINFIRSSTQKMDRLIGGILKLSREGHRSLKSESLHLRDVITSSADAIRHQLTSANGEIKLDIRASIISSDRLSLEQIFGNLLDNAVKYRAQNRPLRIVVRAEDLGDGRVAVDVTDNGRGIAPHDVDRIFGLFRRAGELDQPGDGIGLASVRILLRNIGGDISVSSELGVGSSFHLTLPLTIGTLKDDESNKY